MSLDAASFRPIRSFVRRRGRMTTAQRSALENLWSIYGLDSSRAFDSAQSFGRIAPLVIEIGFGNGDNLADYAEKYPEINYLGIEVHEPGIGHLMNRLDQRAIQNVRLFRGDAIEILRDRIEDASVEAIKLLFPDPWPKKRHHKRRLVSAEFARLIARKLRSGGVFHAATDWSDYANQILRIMEACEDFGELGGSCASQGFRSERTMTRFERRGIGLGHQVSDLIFIRR